MRTPVTSFISETPPKVPAKHSSKLFKQKGDGAPMSGRGKVGKSAKSGTAGTAKRHRRQVPPVNKISGPAVRRLARRAGVTRVGSGCLPEINKAATHYLTDLLDCCKIYCMHAKRKTVACMDVIYSLKRLGTKYMGF